MKKLFLSMALLAAGASFGQTLFVPSGTSGIGTSTVTGNVGVGTNAPAGKLDIRLGGFAGIPRIVFNQETDHPTINFYRPTGLTSPNAFPWKIQTNHYGEITFQTGNPANIGSEQVVTKFALSQNNAYFNTNLGIGTSTPTEKLDVNGSIKISNPFGSLRIKNSWVSGDQGGSIRLQAENSSATPYIDFVNDLGTSQARFIYRNNALNLEYSKLNLDNQGLEFLHSAWGNGYGAKIIGSDDGNGSTSMRFQVRSNNANFSDALRIQTNGKISIGNSSLIPTQAGSADVSNYKLFVEGGILSEEVRVALKTTWADYVFAPSYKLKTIDEVATFIKDNGHLPNVPSAKQVEADGINVAEMAKIQMEKIEELTLYIIELKKEIDALKAKK